MTTDHTPTVAILQALDAGIAAIRKANPDVPAAIAVTIASGKGKTHGHFAKDRWADTNGTDVTGTRHELNMAPESFERGAEATFTTLLHETVHALAEATGIEDTSRQGRFHNKRFRKLAEAMGLVCEADNKIGTRTVGLTDAAKTTYAKPIAALATALVSYRTLEFKPKAPKTTIRVACACDYPVTVPIKWWNDYGQDQMRCQMCIDDDTDGGAFSPVE